MCSVAPGSIRIRVQGCTGLSSCWLLVVSTLGIRLAGSLVGSCTGAGFATVVSAMGVYWFVLAVPNCRMGLSRVTVPLVPVLRRLLGNNHALSSASVVLSM